MVTKLKMSVVKRALKIRVNNFLFLFKQNAVNIYFEKKKKKDETRHNYTFQAMVITINMGVFFSFFFFLIHEMGFQQNSLLISYVEG